MRRIEEALVLAALLLTASCGQAGGQETSGAPGALASSTVDDDDDDDADEGEDDADEQEQAIALADVPAAVLAAAQKAAPGVTFTSALVDLENGATVYELMGGDLEVEVSADAEVLEIERAD